MSETRDSLAAAIDIGTNSTKMTVASIAGGAPRIVFDRSEVTRLGQGVDASGVLRSDAVARTLAAVVRFANEARSAGATHIIAAGTSALRDAQNGGDFLESARREAGVKIQIIDGDREAQLAYSAVRYDPSLWGGAGSLDSEATLVVFDIGGGSTELIVGGSSGMDRYRSLNIGAVRLTERFIEIDPPSAADIAALEQCVDDQLAQFDRPESLPVIAGIGGTAVNLAAVRAGDRSAELHGTTVSRRDVVEIRTRLQRLPLDLRRQTPGLEPERADVIVAGAAILDRLLAYFRVEQFHVSTRGLRYGLLAEYTQTQTAS